MKAALKALGSTIVELLDSKKFAMAVLGVVAAGAAHVGLNFSPEQAFLVVSPLIAVILGQSHVDATDAKAAASVKVAAMMNPNGSPAAIKVAQAGFARSEVMIALAGLAVAIVAVVTIACGPKAIAAEHAAVTCTEDAAEKALEASVTSILTTGGDDWERQLLALGTNGLTNELACAVSFVEQLLGAKVGGVTADNATAIARADKFLSDLQARAVKVPAK